MGLFAKCDKGASAVEAALTLPIFFALLLALFDVGLYFFSKSTLMLGLDSAKRTIQTGEIQGVAAGSRKAYVEDLVCRGAILPGCAERTSVRVAVLGDERSSRQFGAGIDPEAFDVGGGGDIIGIQITYELPPSFIGPILEGKRGEDETVRINAMTVFRSEPF